MKKAIIILSLALVVFSAFIRFTDYKPGIHGTIEPPEGVKKVWAIMGNDSVSVIPVSGKFSMEVKPGNWTVIVEAVKPFRNTVINNILVLETQSTDTGVIKLEEE